MFLGWYNICIVCVCCILLLEMFKFIFTSVFMVSEKCFFSFAYPRQFASFHKNFKLKSDFFLKLWDKCSGVTSTIFPSEMQQSRSIVFEWMYLSYIPPLKKSSWDEFLKTWTNKRINHLHDFLPLQVFPFVIWLNWTFKRLQCLSLSPTRYHTPNNRRQTEWLCRTRSSRFLIHCCVCSACF